MIKLPERRHVIQFAVGVSVGINILALNTAVVLHKQKQLTDKYFTALAQSADKHCPPEVAALIVEDLEFERIKQNF